MHWIATLPAQNLRFEIRQDSRSGFYIYIWKDDKGAADYLQDRFEQAISFTLKKYGVPENAWIRVS